jgi:hypothetical protein
MIYVGDSSNNTQTPAKATEPKTQDPDRGGGRRRRVRPFPALPFEDALVLGVAIQQHAAGQRVRRLTLFDNMGRPADSKASRNLITASGQYGITTGSYTAEYLELTPDGRQATADDVPPADRLKARFRIGVENNQWFKHLHDAFKDTRLPAPSVLGDSVREIGLDDEFVAECVELFVVNAKFLGLLRTVAGAERLLTIEHVLDDFAERARGSAMASTSLVDQAATQAPSATVTSPSVAERSGTSLDDVCFYIAPIGDEESVERAHSDLFMGALVENAVQEFGLRLVRADQIGKPGLITAQMIEHIAQAPLVIADLSFHNPNVFYELALRHAVRKPIVQLIRASDRIPFDLQPFRTIVIDTTSIYTLVPKLETYRAEIASQIRLALEDSQQAENPLSAFYPGFWSAVPAT